MGATDRFSTEEVQRILGLTGKQLDYWNACASFPLTKMLATAFTISAI